MRIGMIDAEEAERTLALFAEMAAQTTDDGGASRMKYIDEFRDGDMARGHGRSASRAEADPARRYSFMEFCGGHTHAISRYGIAELLPAQRAHDPRPGLPGVRAADRPHRPGDRAGAGARRHRVHLWRHDARAGVATACR